MAAKISWHEKNYVSVSLCILRNDLMLYMQTHDRLCSLYLAGSIWRWGIFWLRRSTRKLEAPRARSSTAEAAKTAVCDDRRGIARFFFEVQSLRQRLRGKYRYFWSFERYTNFLEIQCRIGRRKPPRQQPARYVQRFIYSTGLWRTDRQTRTDTRP